MKLGRTGIEWGGPNGDWYWFYWWNPLDQKHRYWGIRQDWHDGPINHIGFWWFNLSWSLPWTRYYWRD
jgi:hypothetical protein